MREAQNVPQITVDGLRVEEPLRLASLRVVQRLDAPSQCQVSWKATTMDTRAIEAAGLLPGTRLSVHVESQPTVIFVGEIAVIEHIHQPSGDLILRVRAYDLLARLQRKQTLQTHVDVNTAELARILADGAGMSLDAKETGPVWPRVIPRFIHDLAMLRHYTARSGLHFVAREGEMHLFTFRSEQDSPLQLTLGENLFEVQLEQNEVRPLNGIQVHGWDIHTGQSRQSKTNRDLEGQGAAHAASETRNLFGSPLESDSQADALADAAWERHQCGRVLLWGVAEGNVALRPGRRVQLQGVAPAMAGPHRLTVVTHTVDAKGGYLCELSTRLDPEDEVSAPPGMVLGEVCDIDDPEKRGRVQVSLSTYADAVTTWMLVMQQGAGAGKGLVSLPEVGDQVIVAMSEGDPSRAIVLGGVYGADGPPHESGGDGSGQHYPYTLTTRAGQRVQLNDADGSIRLENQGGSFLSLNPDGIVLHAAGELVLESPGKRLRLSAQRIDLEQG